ncbi:MAG: hypothetical protein LKF31_09390 [Muribaculaceae bacterium]|nr:hypothetical protein [Muribaculaceae bacterium]
MASQERIFMMPHNSNVPHFETNTPQVTYSTDNNVLEITFTSSQIYVLSVKNASGQTLYSIQVLADGNTHSIQLPTLNSGSTYTLTLSSQYTSFEGVFSTD